MDVATLEQKSDQELRELLTQHQEDLRKMRFSASERQLKKTTDIGKTKKTIARIQTMLTARAAGTNTDA